MNKRETTNKASKQQTKERHESRPRKQQPQTNIQTQTAQHKRQTTFTK